MRSYYSRTPVLLLCLGAGLTSLAAVQKPQEKEDATILAGQVREIFQTRCFECHGGHKTSGGVKILDRDHLLGQKKVIIPFKPDESNLYLAITAPSNDPGLMPYRQPRLRPEEIDAIRRWISQGAPAFPQGAALPAEPNTDMVFQRKNIVGVDYVLKKILADVRARPEHLPFRRYFSINHLLTAGATPDALRLQRDALAKAINHLTWEAEPVKLEAIDSPTNTIFRIDIRRLGWQKQPFQRVQDDKEVGPSPLSLFDLVLLEYPYGIVYEDSETFDQLVKDFLVPAKQVRPIPYIRADWFVSTATRPPLYEDLLQLPFTLEELEKQLGVTVEANVKDGVAKRAGMTVSDVSHNNRAVEWHPLKKWTGSYWRSFDFRSSKGDENIFRNPIHLRESAGEALFTLPNGLHGYFLVNNHGSRVDFAPTDIVSDRNAADQIVRNGLACMRCHDAGIKDLHDTVRPALLLGLPGKPGFDKQTALRLYPGETVIKKQVKEDAERFLQGMKKILGREPTRDEPLTVVSKSFLDAPLHLTRAAGELGLGRSAGLEAVFKAPHFSGLGLAPLAAQGMVRRDAWEDYFDQVVSGLDLGTPVVPLDGVGRRDFPAGPPPLEVELRTNKKNNLFEPDGEGFLYVVNKSAQPVYIELLVTGVRGEKVLLPIGRPVVKADQTFRYPAEGQPGIKIQARLGKELITLFASDEPLPPAELLRGRGITDRVVHPFYGFKRQGDRLKVQNEPARLVKKTIEIETR